MNDYLTEQLSFELDGILENLGFKLDEGKEYDEIKEELLDGILDEQPDFIWIYVRDYLKINYPYHLMKTKGNKSK